MSFCMLNEDLLAGVFLLSLSLPLPSIHTGFNVVARFRSENYLLTGEWGRGCVRGYHTVTPLHSSSSQSLWPERAKICVREQKAIGWGKPNSRHTRICVCDDGITILPFLEKRLKGKLKKSLRSRCRNRQKRSWVFRAFWYSINCWNSPKNIDCPSVVLLSAILLVLISVLMGKVDEDDWARVENRVAILDFRSMNVGVATSQHTSAQSSSSTRA